MPLWQQSTFPRLLLALLLGTIIGAERQWRQRAAGLRTNALVCFGAAAFVDLGSTVAPGTTQIIAYVVSGVGFLGAGAIMKDGGNVRGLNTAATLWCSAAVGACAGAGELLDAVFVTVLLIAINIVLRPLSRYIDQRSLAALDTRTPLPASADLFQRRQNRRRTGNHPRSRRPIAGASRTSRRTDRGDSRTTIVQAVLESSTRDPVIMNQLAEEIRALPWTDSVDWTETESES